MANEKDLKWDASHYWKEQGFQTSARLHLQHWIFSHQLGYHIHPKIHLADTPLKIVDVACANGAWILDLNRQQPQHEYVGLDITSAHFPAADWLPSNVHFHTWDAFAEVPEEYIEAFDIVAIRTIYSAVVNNNIEPLLRNLLKLLKPGGYIQWMEQDASTLKAHAPKDGNAEAFTTLIALQDFFSQYQTKLLPDWLHDLSSSLEQHGCEAIADDIMAPQPALSRAWCDNWLTVWFGVIALLPEAEIPLPGLPGLPGSVSRSSFAELVVKGSAESLKGAWVGVDQRVVVARKKV